MIGTETTTDIFEGIVEAVVPEVVMMKAVDVRADRVALETENDMEAPTDVTTGETGKMTDETEVRETGETEGTARILGEKTTDGNMVFTGRTEKALLEKKIQQNNYEKKTVHTIVQLQPLSSLHPCQNTIMKRMVLEARPQNHNHNLRPDRILTQMRQTKVTRRVRRWTLLTTMTQP